MQFGRYASFFPNHQQISPTFWVSGNPDSGDMQFPNVLRYATVNGNSDDQTTKQSKSTIHSVHLEFDGKFAFQCNLVNKADVGLEGVTRCNVYKEISNKTRHHSSHCVSKKVPTFKLFITLLNLNRFPKFLHRWKACDICYKTTQNYPSHLRHVATLPWDIKNSNFVQIFNRYGKMQTNCIFSAPIIIPVRA